MIIFKIIRWKNFLSTGNIFTEVVLNKTNTTLIIGENGAGKSTILDALSFVLFSKPFRKVNKPQLINSITRKDAVVEVEFDVSGNSYKIVRGLRPNIFEVYQNDLLINQSAEMKDYQEILEKQILKINHKSFCQVVVLGSATFQPFMQLPVGQRRDIIEDLLDLQIFTTMNTLLREKIADNRESIIITNGDKKTIEEKIKLIREHLIEMQNNNDVLILEKKERIEETALQIIDLEQQLKDTQKEAIDLAAQTSNLESLENKMNKLQSLKHKIEANLSVLSKEVDFFNNHDNCPTCKQEIDKEFKCGAISTRNSSIDEINDGLLKLSTEYEKVQKDIKDMLDINSRVNQKIMDAHVIQTKSTSLKEYIYQITEEMNSIQKTSDDQDDSKSVELSNSLDTINETISELEENKLILGVASSLLKDGGIKSIIIKQYIPIINKFINKYLAALEFLVQFELDEEFNETIKSRFRDEFSYASFSVGEKMRINLAILFTWRSIAKLRNSISTNLLIMDEVFDSSLDSGGIEEFMKILTQFTVDTNTFIISHKSDQIGDKFGNVILFEKKQNFSSIAE